MWKTQLEEIQERYKEADWIHIPVKCGHDELRFAMAEILYPDFNPEMDRVFKTGELFSLVCTLKKHLDPISFLFLKATFADDEEDGLFFLQQAQMIEPQNLRFLVMTTFLPSAWKKITANEMEHLYSLNGYTQKMDIKESIRLVSIIGEIQNESPQIRPAEIVQYLSNASLQQEAKFSLLHHIMEKCDIQAIMAILQNLEVPGMQNHWIYQIIFANACYEQGHYKNALRWYQRAIANRNLPAYLYKLEIQYKMAVSLRETGNEGEAIILLREILFSSDLEESYSDYYLHAIADLTAYYVRLKQPGEADKVLLKLQSELVDYMVELTGADFLVCMADKAMLEADFENALYYYKKAFKLNTHPDIGKRIRMLENDVRSGT